MYFHSLPSLQERTTKTANELRSYLRNNLADEMTISVSIEADICFSVVNSYMLKEYHFEFLDTEQSNLGVFTRVSCQVK